jgi:hypothetical protein
MQHLPALSIPFSVEKIRVARNWQRLKCNALLGSALKIFDVFFDIQKAAGIFGGPPYSAEGRFDKRIVVWRPWPCKKLRHAVFLTQPLDRLGFHVAAPSVDELGAGTLRQIQNIFLR